MIPATPQWARLQNSSEKAVELAGSSVGERPWLVENVAGMADALIHKLKRDEKQLKKSELRDELCAVWDAFKIIDRAFQKNIRS